jgi:hypothetical protein
MNLSELFPEQDALPQEWDFILEPNEDIVILTNIKIQVKFNQHVKKLALHPSTLTGAYSLVQLRKLIFSAFSLKKNSNFQIFCAQTNSLLLTDSQLLDAISKCNSMNTILSLKVALCKEEDPCILCVSYDCCHSTTRTSLKRKIEDHDTLMPQFLEPIKIDAPIKRRKLALSGSVPNGAFSVSHALNASAPKQILIKF